MIWSIGVDFKKIGSARFKDILIKNHKSSMDEQKQMLIETFNKWKANEDQVDYITIVGARL